MKKTKDYDAVFKTMKVKHKRLFISVINEAFGTGYPPDAEVELLPSEGYLTGGGTQEGGREIRERVSDFLVRLGGRTYLLECQSYDDGSMAIRIAEYAFITARNYAVWENGKAELTMPEFSVIYIKHTDRTPKKTEVTFVFPGGRRVAYGADNIFLDSLSKEYIIEKRLFPYIPFYIARYEKELAEGGDISRAVGDLEYFRDRMKELYEAGELAYEEMLDLRGFVKTIVEHITDGNPSEERLVKTMGGEILETASEKLIHGGEKQGEEYKIISQVCKKIGKGKEVPEIAEDLEESVANIQRIYDAALPFASKFDQEKIYKEIYKKMHENNAAP